jgi:hypothetical protein
MAEEVGVVSRQIQMMILPRPMAAAPAEGVEEEVAGAVAERRIPRPIG